MRATAITASLASLCAVLSTCTSETGGGLPCGCPYESLGVTPQFACQPTAPPALHVSGPCESSGLTGTPNGTPVPLIEGTGVGTCHATLTLYPSTYTTDIVFSAHWYACGNDPHGCGEAFEPSMSVWTIDNACTDAGTADALD